MTNQSLPSELQAIFNSIDKASQDLAKMRSTLLLLSELQDSSRLLRIAEEKGFRRGYFEGYREALEDAEDFHEIELTEFVGKLDEWKNQEASSVTPPPSMSQVFHEKINNSAAVEAVNKVIESLKGPA